MSHLNRTNIEWCTRTFNPVTGCKHNCPYCYARKIAMRFTGHFKPEFHPDRLDAPARAKKPQRIFVGSMCDLFGDWVPDEWIEQVLRACEAAPQHTYYFLTKNPKRYKELSGTTLTRVMVLSEPHNWWFGRSLTGETKPTDRSRLIATRPSVGLFPTFISMEPMLGPMLINPHLSPDWVIVGAQTNPTVMPERKWVLDIREQCRALEIPLFEKNSLAPLDLPGGLIQEIPQ